MKSYFSKHWYQKWWGVTLILLGILLIIYVISGSMYYYSVLKSIKEGKLRLDPNSGQIVGQEVIIKGVNNYSLGKDEAILTIVAFEDFNCPYCKKGYETLKKVYRNHPNDIQIIHRDYLIGQDSLSLSLAARCAGEQGKFWLMADKLYTEQGNFSIDELPTMAREIGVNIEQFEECYEETRYLDDITYDINDAEILEVNGAPNYFINEYRSSGLLPEDQFEPIIESLLENLKNNN